MAAAHSSDVLFIPSLNELPVHTLLQRAATELSHHMKESAPLIFLITRRQVGNSGATWRNNLTEIKKKCGRNLHILYTFEEESACRELSQGFTCPHSKTVYLKAR